MAKHHQCTELGFAIKMMRIWFWLENSHFVIWRAVGLGEGGLTEGCLAEGCALYPSLAPVCQLHSLTNTASSSASPIPSLSLGFAWPFPALFF